MTRGRKITAARLLRSLGTITTLSDLGNASEVKRLLNGIDHAECAELAAELDAENAAAPLLWSEPFRIACAHCGMFVDSRYLAEHERAHVAPRLIGV